MNGDQTSEFFRRAINVLFVANPKGTSIGILLGVVLDGVIGFFSPLLKTVEWVSVSAIKIWHLMGLGALIMNLPAYISRKDVDASIVKAFKFIGEQKASGNISEWQSKQMYVNLLNKVLESVALNEGKEDPVDRVSAMAIQPNGKDKSGG